MNPTPTHAPEPGPAPDQVADYLRAQGWRLQPEQWRGAAIWSAPPRAATDDEVLLPPRIEYEDDADLVKRALKAIARAEQRDFAEVLRAISAPLVDVQRFHTHPHTPSGTLPLLAGWDAIGGIRGAFTVAARRVLEGADSSVSGGRNSKAVDTFLGTVRLGPTAAGSYIFSAEVPLGGAPEPAAEGMLALEYEPGPGSGPRGIVAEMYRGIAAAGKAARQAEEDPGDELGGFDEGAGQGVTSRLCESLAGLAGHDADRPFEISFQWAPAHPAPLPEGHADGEQNRIAFGRRAGALLKDAAKHLRELENSGTVRMVGTIIAMERDSRTSVGYAKVRGTLRTDRGSSQRTLPVVLDPQQYDRALEAHRGARAITAEGRIATDRNRRELRPDHLDLGE
ncbi:hypothetical protein [Nocardiopsis baichengensis]|uniref:hypothetical protein n=1 Tax=Nocardiopsis baichengensis TaxID=280240 RepID=UPI00034AF535|nr:hypothetical protein [Nocardiopsis baichengensis]